MRRIPFIIAILTFLVCQAHAQATGFNTGMSFGLIGPRDVDRLDVYAKQERVDLMRDTGKGGKDDQEEGVASIPEQLHLCR